MRINTPAETDRRGTRTGQDRILHCFLHVCPSLPLLDFGTFVFYGWQSNAFPI